MTTVPAISGKIGDTVYYQCVMNAKDLIARTESVEEYFSEEDYKEMGERGKLQRKLDKRYLNEIAPYLLRNRDRFFNSFVVNLDPQLCEFKSLSNFTVNIDNKFYPVADSIQFDYRDQAKNIGFLHIKDTGSMYILDGQHRMAALRAAINPTEDDRKVLNKKLEQSDELHLLKSDNGLKQDQYSVLFVLLDNKKSQRTLFTDINTYARKISQSEMIGMDERNGYRKIIQNLIDENLVFNHADWIVHSGSSLPESSLKITTKKHLEDIVTMTCEYNGHIWPKNKFPETSEFNKGQTISVAFLNEMFSNIEAYKNALKKDPTDNNLPALRKKESKVGLIFKPLPQVALAEAILLLKEKSDLDTSKIYKKINNIDWSYEYGSQFTGAVINIEGNIQTGKRVQSRLRDLIICWILGNTKAEEFFEGSGRFEELTEEWQNSTGKKGPIPEVKTA